MIKEVSEDDIDLSSFEYQNDLNTSVWDNDKLKESVRKRLLKVATDFYDELGLKTEVEDIIFTGSLANYNWSSFSDIDLHIVLDFDKVEMDSELLKFYVDAKKKIWNDAHNILIYKFPIELYIQDVHERHDATGIYSLYKNDWIVKPSYNKPTLNSSLIKKKAAFAETMVDDLYNEFITSNSKNQFQKLLVKLEKFSDRIKRMRKAGLEENGEFSYENIVFKVLRRFDYMQIIMDLKIKVYDKLKSL